MLLDGMRTERKGQAREASECRAARTGLQTSEAEEPADTRTNVTQSRGEGTHATCTAQAPGHAHARQRPPQPQGHARHHAHPRWPRRDTGSCREHRASPQRRPALQRARNSHVSSRVVWPPTSRPTATPEAATRDSVVLKVSAQAAADPVPKRGTPEQGLEEHPAIHQGPLRGLG